MNTITHKCKGIEKLSESDIWSWVTYVDPFNWNERWKIKSFNNERKVAFVVFKCNWYRLSNFWKDFTAPSCNYMDLEF